MLKIIQLDSMETEENKNGKCANCANVQTIRELECVNNILCEIIRNFNLRINYINNEIKEIKSVLNK